MESPFQYGQIISYREMSNFEEMQLQKGMNWRPKNSCSIFLMSQQKNAPYPDMIQDDGRVLIYEGHDVPNYKNGPDPKTLDQPDTTPSGSATENGKFKKAAERYKRKQENAEVIKVYERIKPGIWVFNGFFNLTDVWMEERENRKVFKFKLKIIDEECEISNKQPKAELEHARMIPASVKQAVWKRDAGKCNECGSTDNLHYDHILPYSKGGTSLSSENIQLLCARHNLSKSNKII